MLISYFHSTMHDQPWPTKGEPLTTVLVVSEPEPVFVVFNEHWVDSEDFMTDISNPRGRWPLIFTENDRMAWVLSVSFAYAN